MKVGFEEIVIDSFWETFCKLLDNLPETPPRRLHELMTEEGASLVWFLRMVTSGRIKAHADRFAPFIGDEFADVERFCHVEVEPVNVECDQVQIIARTCAEIELYGAFRLEYVRWSSTVSVRHPFEKNSTAKTSAHDVASTMTL